MTASRRLYRVAAKASLQDGRFKELADSINVSRTSKRSEPSQYASSFVKLARFEFLPLLVWDSYEHRRLNTGDGYFGPGSSKVEELLA